MFKLRRGSGDNTMLIIAGAVAAVLLVGVMMFMFWPKETRALKVGDVVVAQAPADAKIEYVNTGVTKLVEKNYKEYGTIPTFLGESMLSYEAAKDDAMGKLAEYLNAVVNRFSELAKAELASVAQSQSNKKEQVNVNKLATEVHKMVEQIHAKVRVTGAIELMRYRSQGKYYVILYYNPSAALKALQEQQNVIEQLAKQYGAQSRAVFDEVTKTLKEAYKETPLEKK